MEELLSRIQIIFIVRNMKPSFSHSPLSGQPAFKAKPPRKSSAGSVFLIIFVLLLLGGAGYYVFDSYQKDKDKIRLAAEKEAELARQKALAKEEEERARLEKERLAREAAERARLAAEEAARKKGGTDKVVEVVPDKPGEVKPEPGKRIKAADDDKRLVVYKEPILVTGVNATLDKYVKTWDDALNMAIETNRFDIYRNFLKDMIVKGSKQLVSFGKFDMRAYYKNPKYSQAVNAYRLLSLLTDDSIMNILSEEGGETFFRALLSNEDGAQDVVLNAFSGKETPSDVERILKTWMPLWAMEKGEMRKKYMSLSLACALVDPSTLGPSKPKYGQALEMPEVYKFFREKSEKGLLRGDITKMKPSQLIYVVDVRLPISEMEWAIENMRKKGVSRKGWSGAYSMIRYRMDRASTGKNPYDDYIFSEILEHGGICMDQAYFAVNTAKSNGIPASYVTGDGPLGGHAWFVYMPDDRTWASAGGIGYKSGKTTNPQTAQPMHESLFTLTTDKRNGGDRLVMTMDMLEISRTLRKIGMEEAAIDLLNQAKLNTPGHPFPWLSLIDYYVSRGEKTTLAEWEFFVGSIRREFKDRPDFLELAKEVEEKYIYPKRSLDENVAEMNRQRRKLEKDTGEGRSDLSAESVKSQADALAEAKRFDDVEKLYKKALRDYGSRTDAFKIIIRDYYNFTADDKAWRAKAVVNIDKAFEKYANTKSANLFVAKQEVGLMKTIAGFYREIGEEKKAKSMEEKGDLRLKRVQRGIREENDR